MTVRYRRASDGYRLERVETPTPAPPPPERPRLPLRPPPPRPNSVLVRSGLLLVAAEGLRSERRRLLALRFRDEAARRREEKRLGRPLEEGRDFPGPLVRDARQVAKISQRDLARELPFGRGLIASVELGYRSCPPQLADWARQVLRAAGKEVPG